MRKKKLYFVIAWALFFVLVSCSSVPTEEETELQAKEIFDALLTEDVAHTYDTYGSKEWKEKVSAEAFKEMVLPNEAESPNNITVESVMHANEDRMVVDGKITYPTYTKDLRIIFTEQLMIESFEVLSPVAQLNFPQTILEENIIIGADTHFPLDGKITLPKETTDELPIVILVHGSGPADYDESLYAYKPFRDIAWGLAEQGVASIRYDKRTFVYGNESFSEGIEKMNVQEETIDDTLEAVKVALGDARIDSESIYLIGHSLGGMLGPRIAENSSDIAGFISLAGSPRTFAEIMFDQQELLLDKQSLPKTVHKQQIEQIEQMQEEVKRMLALPEDDILEGEVLGLPAYYLWEMEQHPVEEIITSLNIPMYIMQGDEDFQVLKEKDYAAWKNVLADKEDVTFSSYPKLNHFFIEETENPGTLLETYEYPGTVSEEVIDDIATWVHEQ